MSGEVAELDRAAGLQPTGWTLATLGDMFAVSTPGHWGDEPDSDGNILVLRSTNFRKAGGLVYETAAKRQFDERKLIQKRLQRGDIILERSGGSPAQPVGRARRFDAEGCYSASNFMQIMRAADQVDDWFACYLLDYIYDQGLTEALQKATTGIRNLDFKAFLDLPVLVPPLDEQRRIAEVLRSVDEAIAATLATNKQAQIALDSARANLLTPLAEAAVLGDVCDVVGGYAFKSTSFVESGVKVLRISNITEGGVDFSGRVVCVDEQDVRGLDRFRLRPLDTVVALSGATTGKMCVFAFGEPVYANQRVAFIRVKEGLADQGYINHVLSMLTASVRQSAYGGAQPNISTKEIAAMEIALPHLTEQHEIAEVLDGLSQAVALGDQVLIAQQAAKATLMSDLLSGRVRVPA